jgi:Leucine Rich repeat
MPGAKMKKLIDLQLADQKGVANLQSGGPANCTLCDSDAMYLASKLAHNTNITELDLRGNSIGCRGVSAIAEALKLNATVVWVRLDSNAVGVAGALAMAEALKVNRSVTTLLLGNNKIGATGASAIAEALVVNETLTTLVVCRNGIQFANHNYGPDSESEYESDVEAAHCHGIAFTEALQKNKTLTRIDMGYNSIDAVGALMLARVLKVNETLTHLELSDNCIGDEGACAIADALIGNRTLVHIDITKNTISDQGALMLANALQVNTTLQFVWMQWNPISSHTQASLRNSCMERKLQRDTAEPALLSIFPSARQQLWPAAGATVAATTKTGMGTQFDDDSSSSSSSSSAVIDSFYSSPIFDVQVFCIIRAYLIPCGFTGELHI